MVVKACECVCRTRGWWSRHVSVCRMRGWWSRHVSVFVGCVGGGQGM